MSFSGGEYEDGRRQRFRGPLNNVELFNVKADGRPTYGCHCNLDLKDKTRPSNS
jgi:hypothetical protein